MKDISVGWSFGKAGFYLNVLSQGEKRGSIKVIFIERCQGEGT